MILSVNSVVPHVLLKRAPEGTGIIAGGPARAVLLSLLVLETFELSLLDQTTSRMLFLAVLDGLAALKTPEEIAKNRGKSDRRDFKIIGGRTDGR